MTLPTRDVPALIEALRIRALRLTGEPWERTATAAMMTEAADQLEQLSWFRDVARQVFEFGCACSDVFDSLEAFDQNQRLVHTGRDDVLGQKWKPSAPRSKGGDT